jgi:hypothetical protein
LVREGQYSFDHWLTRSPWVIPRLDELWSMYMYLLFRRNHVLGPEVLSSVWPYIIFVISWPSPKHFWHSISLNNFWLKNITFFLWKSCTFQSFIINFYNARTCYYILNNYYPGIVHLIHNFLSIYMLDYSFRLSAIRFVIIMIIIYTAVNLHYFLYFAISNIMIKYSTETIN